MKAALHEKPPLPSVSPAQLVDFDFFRVRPIDSDLHLGWKRLHDGPDIFYTPRNGGHWVVARAQDIDRILRDHENFSNAGVAMSRDQREMLLAPGEVDPPEHTAYRSLLNPWFGPKPIRAMEEEARTLAAGLIDGFSARGGCEFRSEFAQRMPIMVFLSLMKLPMQDAEALLPAADLLTRDPDPQSFHGASNTMMGYLQQRIAERKAAPKDDLISHLLACDIEAACGCAKAISCCCRPRSTTSTNAALPTRWRSISTGRTRRTSISVPGSTVASACTSRASNCA